MRHSTRLARLERGTRRHHEPAQIFAQTQAAAAAFRAQYGRPSTPADLWRMVNLAIAPREDVCGQDTD